MLKKKIKKERGQAIVLIAIAIVGLVGFTGLAVDGGNAFSNKRQAQNAADNAAISAALKKTRGGTSAETEAIAQTIASTNGFDNNDSKITVIVSNPPLSGPYSDCFSSAFDCDEYIQVTIESEVATFFASVVGVSSTTSRVEAVARAKPPTTAIPFDGAAVVGLNPSSSSCAFDSGNSNSAKWTLVGGGLFSNGCAFSKNGNSVTIPNDKCVFTVGSASNFTCQQSNQSSLFVDNNEIAGMMPASPPCDGTPEGGINVASNPSSFTFENGIYCVTNFDAFRKKDIVLNNASLYVVDDVFDVGFQGGGGFAGTASSSGRLKGIYMYIKPASTPCPTYNDKNSQVIEYRGNGDTGMVGMILAPTACIDFRGNSNGEATHSQVIGWNVSSNGTAELHIDYNPEENTELPVPPQIELAE